MMMVGVLTTELHVDAKSVRSPETYATRTPCITIVIVCSSIAGIVSNTITNGVSIAAISLWYVLFSFPTRRPNVRPPVDVAPPGEYVGNLGIDY